MWSSKKAVQDEDKAEAMELRFDSLGLDGALTVQKGFEMMVVKAAVSAM